MVRSYDLKAEPLARFRVELLNADGANVLTVWARHTAMALDEYQRLRDFADAGSEVVVFDGEKKIRSSKKEDGR
jgi:hypothetical protein